MDTKEKDIIFSESVKAGKRIYYLDVKQSRNGDRYISITESKKVVDDDASSAETGTQPHVSFEKHKIFLYKEDFEKFQTALSRVIGYVKNSNHYAAAEAQQRPKLMSVADLNIEF